MSFNDIFNDKTFIKKIQNRFPKYIYDLNNAFAKDGKLSPDIGTLREKMIIGIFSKHFGDNFSDKLPPQEAEADFILFNELISFKTSISKSFKLIWTSNYELAIKFYEEFTPKYPIILLIFQKSVGGLYYFSIELLQKIRKKLKSEFLNKPKSGTNPRGVSLSTKGFNALKSDPDCKYIPIDWNNISKGPNTSLDFIQHYYDIW
ncbi:ThaI family type II restriction endonuclease [Promethearchaeum syntrophicum]|uniref:ThaI family type II restriction endonuclease n=1 Tax=Promethearchaeum syntrophicum TaxID=2594042 RepID=A0A5B9D9I0_9ARCH|nr:ThaI family type II restriction endonuclease [Candidatus Prometheoarchaeum syntrophicum]QEE15743.1 hypothetical protein DSAG12_01570 [Candidatus Prometheoarchaeum syntrophicum]